MLPTGIANLVGWWYAGAGVYKDLAKTLPVSANADPALLMADQSGNGWDLHSHDNVTPIPWDTNVLNGQPALVPTGLANQIFLNLAYGGTLQPGTVFLAFKLTSLAAYQALFCSTSSTGLEIGVTTTGHLEIESGNTATIGASTAVLAVGTPYLVCVTLDAGGNWQIFINGVLDSSGTHVITLGGTQLGFPGGNYGYTEPANAALFEGACWSRILTTSPEISSMFTYLNNKFFGPPTVFTDRVQVVQVQESRMIFRMPSLNYAGLLPGSTGSWQTAPDAGFTPGTWAYAGPTFHDPGDGTGPPSFFEIDAVTPGQLKWVRVQYGGGGGLLYATTPDLVQAIPF